MPNEAPKRLNSTLLDTTVLNALKKYITVARQQGRDECATVALEVLSKFDKKAHANVVAEWRKTDLELVSAIKTYHEAVTSQNRADRIQWANESFAALNSDAVIDLRDELSAKISDLSERISALAPATKKR
jgi:hypothetical protein